MRYHLKPMTMAIVKKTTNKQFPQNIKKELPHDLAIPLLHIYPKKLKSGAYRGICPHMFLNQYSQQQSHGNNVTGLQQMIA